MKRASKIVDGINIASPCHMSWDRMSGDDRVRFCESCKLHVFNISEMDVEEAASLISKTDGRLCIRLYRRRDGTVITRDCPVGAEVKQRKARLAFFGGCAALFAGLVSLISGPSSQTMGAIAPHRNLNTAQEDGNKATPAIQPLKPDDAASGHVVMGMRVNYWQHKSN